MTVIDHLLTAFQDLLAGCGPATETTSDLGDRLPRAGLHLPADSSVFTDREAALDRLRDWALPNGSSGTSAPVIAIHGRAGTGKSALAIHLAHELHSRYPYAQLYVDLMGTGPTPPGPLEPAEALRRLLVELGVADDDIPAELEELTATYRAELCGRAAIVVLDNATDVSQVEALRPRTPTCLVLVTSRRRLDEIGGSTQFCLGVMSEAESLTLLRRIAGDHVLSVDNEPLTTRVAQLCGCLPLALRIAGQRLRSNSVGEILADLEDRQARLGALFTAGLDIRKSFGVSYEALSELERTLFRRLRLMVEPSFGVQMAATLLDRDCGVAGAALDRLVDEHLLERDGEAGFRFDDLIGLYADDRLEVDEPAPARDAARRRMLLAYLEETMARAALLDRAIPHMVEGQPRPAAPLDQQLEALDWFDGHRQKLTEAWQLADRLQLHDITWKLAACLGPFFVMRGSQPEWSEMQEAALRAAYATQDNRAVAWTSLGAGLVYRYGGLLEKARGELQAAHDSAEAGEWGCLRGRAAHLMGCVERRGGRLPEAISQYGIAARFFAADGLGSEWANTMLHLAAALYEQEAPAVDSVILLANAARAELMDVPEELWTVRMLGKIDEYLARILRVTGKLEDAGVRCFRCHQSYSRIRYRHGQARARRELGVIRTRQQLWGQAERYLEESRTLFAEMGDERAADQVGQLLDDLEKERVRHERQCQPEAGDEAPDSTPAAADPPRTGSDGRAIFISYSQQDTETAERIATELRQAAHQVWFAPWSIGAGEPIPRKVNEALEQCDTFLVLLSPRSVASRWVSTEWEAAMAAANEGQDIAIVPIEIEPVEVVPRLLLRLRRIDMTPGKFDTGMTELKRLLARGVRDSPPAP